MVARATRAPRRAARRARSRPPSMKSDAVGVRERARRSLLGDEHRARQTLDQVEERLGRLRVELRGRLVEQQQPRPQRERRGETDALQLAPRELADRPLGEVLGADRARAPRRPAARSPPARPRGSRGRTRPRSRPGSSPTWSSGILEDRRDVTDERRRRASRACRDRRPRPARRRRRRGSAARARRARAAASTCRCPRGRAARRARRRRSSARRRRAPACRRRTRSAGPRPELEPPGHHHDRERAGEREPVEASPRRSAAPACARAAVAARLHRLGDVEAALERAREERREQPDRAELDAAARAARPAGRARRARAPAAAGSRARPRPSTDAPSPRRRQQAVVVDAQRVHGEREPDGREPQALEEPVRQLLARHVESSRRTGIVGPVQSGCEPITSTNGVRTTTSSALVSVPTRYGQRRSAARATRRRAAAAQMTRDDPGPADEQRSHREGGEQRRCRARRSSRVAVPVAKRRLVGGEPCARPASRARAGSPTGSA